MRKQVSKIELHMKKLIYSSLTALGMFALLTSPAFAKDKEVTITGEGKCAKCMLKETSACQNAIEVTKGAKKTVYYLADNDVSKKFHEQVCKEAKKVTATGTVKRVDGKRELTASKIEVVK